MGPRTAARLGRPTKNPDEVKSKTVQLRVTREQHQLLREGSEAAGKTLSAWLLLLGLRAAEKVKGSR